MRCLRSQLIHPTARRSTGIYHTKIMIGLSHLSRPVSLMASITARTMTTAATGKGRLADKVAIVTASTDG